MKRRFALAIAADHPAFDGHFPGRPIVPGVVLLDHSLRALASDVAGRWKIGNAKFLSFVAPGEPVHLDVDDAAANGSLRLSVVAGSGPSERVAMTGTVSPAAET